MAWQQLKLQINSEHIDFLEQQMLSQGALSVTYLDAKDQPVFQKEPGDTPLWDETCLVCLFDDSTDLRPALDWIHANPAIHNKSSVQIERIEDQAWERSWMTDFSAMQFGERLWICPSWQDPPDPAATNIILDPGLAFGSGSHATTAMCLQWLEQTDLAGKTVIDYGCGSGVLAIAAALLGAGRVVAVDNDPQAIVATRANCTANNIPGDAVAAYLPDDLPRIKADILLANILAEPLIELAPRFASLTTAGAAIVLSGLLAEQSEQVLATYGDDFIMTAPKTDQQWVRLSGTRRH